MHFARTFTAGDQVRFAEVSGDRNPIHLDAVAARRTRAGRPVVHGLHLLLWTLDELASADTGLPPMRRLKVRFHKFVGLDEPVSAVLAKRTGSATRLDLTVAGLIMVQITIDFGPPEGAAEGPDGVAVPAPAAPWDLPFDAMADLSGRLDFASSPEVSAALFPAASRWLGPRVVAALAATTLLVGMVCPGLHSIYGGLTVERCEEPDPDDRLRFRVTGTDARLRLIHIAIAGGGLTGSIESFARLPPVTQVPSRELVGVVEPDAFAGSTALVIGGSRGLGEVAAKLLAAGGAKVTITYRVGRAEAETVAQEIRSAGGRCDVRAYAVGLPAAPQLVGLDEAPTHAYYFATPMIFGAQAALLDRKRLDTFMDVYVEGFVTLAETLRGFRRDVSLFYPSSVAVAERPRGMTEYAMSKAAGEILCDEMNRVWAPLHVTVRRLPRLPTDQTVTVMPAEGSSAVASLLPIIHDVQA